MDIIGLLPSFGGLIWTIIAFVVALSVIVAVHEYGHYIVGRWSGIHAEVFSLGFGPVLWSRHDKRGTKWQIAALPFGGYVKFLGDADAASGKDGEAIQGLSKAELRRTMHGAPLWARAATVAAGPFFNFAMTILILTGFALFYGTVKEPLTVGEIKPMPEDIKALKSGDVIVALAGVDTADSEAFFSVLEELDPEQPVKYTLERDGAVIQLEGSWPFPARVDSVSPQSAAIAAGLQVGDVITAIDGTPIVAFKQLQAAVAASEGKALLLNVWRNGEFNNFSMVPRKTDFPNEDGEFETRYLIGISGGLVFEPATESPGLFEAIGGGFTRTWSIIKGTFTGIYSMITGAISSCNLNGPIGIAQISGQMASQGAASFLQFIAVLSTAVGLMNLFPIPVLDGGHLLFHAYEAVFRKPPNERVLNVLMTIGLVLIGSLMIFALGHDLFCP